MDIFPTFKGMPKNVGRVQGDSTEGATLLDATQWHLGTYGFLYSFLTIIGPAFVPEGIFSSASSVFADREMLSKDTDFSIGFLIIGTVSIAD